MPFASSHGMRIHWKAEGDPAHPALVLLNSIGTDMGLWSATLEALRPHFLVLRIDTRGHGASDAPTGDYRMETLADDVAAVLDAAGVATATIAGVSLGGMIAMQLAIVSPERVAALALVCASATMDRQVWTTRVEAVRAGGMAGIVELAMGRFLSPEFTRQRPEVAATVRRGLLAMAPAGYAGCATAIRDMTIADRLGAIACPTLVVTGRRDTSTPLEGHGDYLLAHIPGARHVALDAAHLAPLEAPDDLSRELVALSVR